MIRTALQATLSLVLASGALAAQQAPSRLVGTWRIVEFCDVRATGDTTHPLGPRPIGFFIYDPSGTLMIQAMRTPHAGAFAADSVALAGMAEVAESYFGYFGRYTVTSDSTVIHHVTGGTLPGYVGTDQRRNYRIRGDTLSIGGNPVPGCRRLIRVR
jgi:hypothetical protein